LKNYEKQLLFQGILKLDVMHTIFKLIVFSLCSLTIRAEESLFRGFFI